MVDQHGAHGPAPELEQLERDALVDLSGGDHLVADARDHPIVAVGPRDVGSRFRGWPAATGSQ